jgi:hypothetical protein
MTKFKYPFNFTEDPANQVKGTLELDEPLPYNSKSQGGGFYKSARILLDNGPRLDLVLYDSAPISKFIYLHDGDVDPNLLQLIGLSANDFPGIQRMTLPGQLCMGSDRTKMIGQALMDIIAAPILGPTITSRAQQNMAIFPIAREGLKYQVAEAIFEIFGYYCDEILLDAHHVFDTSVPVYNRKVELGLFKDKDLDKEEHENIIAAFIADSIASGLVMKEVIARINERFTQLEQVEVIAPLATIRGLCRLAASEYSKQVNVRVHVFETLLNALPPDFYYSAHLPDPELHIRPDMEEAYRQWWGKDGEGNHIADTACAGYGWSEVFYSPRKQIQMMNNELFTRHQLTIDKIVLRNNR